MRSRFTRLGLCALIGLRLQSPAPAVGVPPPSLAPPAGFERFQAQYPLPPVHDYTFLGTELSETKPIVTFTGRIEGWFDPVDRVPWIQQAIESGSFSVEVVGGFLPALKYTYRKPDSAETCDMTVFAADAEPAGAIHLYVRLVVRTGNQEPVEQCLRLKDTGPINGRMFSGELQGLWRHWAAFFERGRQFPGTEPALLNAAKASLTRALITYTGLHPHYGVKAYAGSQHDGFPPTTIALVNCLLDWGQTEAAQAYLSYYFQRFVTDEGRFDYYGPSLAEYGQMLQLVRRLSDSTRDQSWLTPIRPRLEQMRRWLWAEIESAAPRLIAGVPEADTRDQIDLYFHNNAWCWRGLKAVSGVLGRRDEARCEAYRQAILKAIDEVTDRSADPPFIPPVARKLKPFSRMTQDSFASYTNYRYWLELLSSGILSRQQADAIIRYRLTHDGEVGGMTRFADRADDWPIAEYGLARLAWGDTEAARRILYSHLAGHVTLATSTAYESVNLVGNPYREAASDYCVPSQLVVPRLLAAWRSANSSTHTLEIPVLPGEIQVDGRLDQVCNDTRPAVEQFVIAGQPSRQPQKTRAWLFWQPDRLVLAFDCMDADIVAAAPSMREHDVDPQDRVELFLWSGDEEQPYACLELGARGAVHDYAARFYRRFDDNWSPAGWDHAVCQTPTGYQVEAAIPRAALEEFGLRFEAGARWRAGLFRADFSCRNPGGGPTWITWVDAQGPEPDFHVTGSFGEIVLGRNTRAP